MPEFEPERLVRWTGGSWSGTPPGRISGFSYDTRILREGEGFVALKSERRDGHHFLNAAEAAGASMALVNRLVDGTSLPQLVVSDPLTGLQNAALEYRRSLDATVIGITGSCGKTSTKDLLKVLLGVDRTHATEGNLNNTLGVPVTLLRAEPAQHEALVVEAGINGPGEMDVLEGMIEPDVAIVTMVGPAHLEQMGSLEAIAREKAKMLRGPRARGRLYFPATCLKWEPFRKLLADSVVVRQNDSRAHVEKALRVYEYAIDGRAGGGFSLALRTQDGPVLLFPLPFCSPGQAQNAALAVAVALDQGVAPDTIRERFKQWKPSPNRGEKLKAGDQFFYADCYNANPVSVSDALLAFADGFDPGLRRLYVLGSMNELGAEAPAFHRKVGEGIQLRPGDVAFFIGEYASDLLKGLKANDPVPGSYQLFERTEDAQAGVAHFSGAILLKGSRSYCLEQLLPLEYEAMEKMEGVPC